jgi:hypothetical protein
MIRNPGVKIELAVFAMLSQPPSCRSFSAYGKVLKIQTNDDGYGARPKFFQSRCRSGGDWLVLSI